MGQEMGKKTAAGKTLALQYDADGKLRHDAIARVGHDKGKVRFKKRLLIATLVAHTLTCSQRCFQIIHSRLSDMKQKFIDEDDETFHRPDDDEVRTTTEVTKQALEKITNAKVPRHVHN